MSTSFNARVGAAVRTVIAAAVIESPGRDLDPHRDGPHAEADDYG